MACVIKYDYEDGMPLSKSKVVLWCGREHHGMGWLFQDAQHAALADKPICNKCRASIIKSLTSTTQG